MRVPNAMLGDLGVILQAALVACGDEDAVALSNNVPHQRGIEAEVYKAKVATWMRRAMALLSTRLDEIPAEGAAVNRKEAGRRLHAASLLGINAVLADPVLSPLIPESERQNIEDGLRSFDEVWEAVEHGLAGEQICPECGTAMLVMFTSAECPACGARPVQS